MRLRSVALVAALLMLGACAGGAAAPSVSTALTEAQIAAYAVTTGYTVAANAVIAAGPSLTPSQKIIVKALNEDAYQWVKTLAAEAQAGAVVASDLAGGQKALAELSAFLKGLTL